MKSLAYLALLSILAMCGCGGSSTQPSATTTNAENWPAFTPTAQQIEAAHIARDDYRASHVSYVWGMDDYTATGDYFHSAGMLSTFLSAAYRYDANGIPLVKSSAGDWYYNPTTVAQFALMQYARYQRGSITPAEFIRAVDGLLALGSSDGAFRYPIPLDYLQHHEPGWVSGMAQGQVLSVLARAYFVTSDDRYLSAGRKALAFMVLPTSQGGTRGNLASLDQSLSDEVTFEEVPESPSSTILNGNMYALLGLYDWAQATGDTTAKTYFVAGTSTTAKMLRYYDMGAFTAYDMRHMAGHPVSFAGGYHADHIVLTNALYHLTGNEEFAHYRDVWRSYVD